jgi:hypothetical protein
VKIPPFCDPLRKSRTYLYGSFIKAEIWEPDECDFESVESVTRDMPYEGDMPFLVEKCIEIMRGDWSESPPSKDWTVISSPKLSSAFKLIVLLPFTKKMAHLRLVAMETQICPLSL